MKTKLFCCCAGLIISAYSFAQDTISLVTIKIYLVDWQSHPTRPYSLENFNGSARYYFETGAEDFHKMFLDASEQNESLESYIEFKDASVKHHSINAMVEFIYNHDTLIVFFDIDGNYYYKNKWHARHNEMYVLLFKYFSNELIPEKILKAAKKNYRGDFWYD